MHQKAKINANPSFVIFMETLLPETHLDLTYFFEMIDTITEKKTCSN